MKCIARRVATDLEAWAEYDPDMELWLIYASKDGTDYIGAADNIDEARAVAREWFEDRASY
jgi:hypothetical protein